MPTAKAIQRLSWGVGDRLPKVTAKARDKGASQKGDTQGCSKLALNETALGVEVSSQQRLPRRQSEAIYRKAFTLLSYRLYYRLLFESPLSVGYL